MTIHVASIDFVSGFFVGVFVFITIMAVMAANEL